MSGFRVRCESDVLRAAFKLETMFVSSLRVRELLPKDMRVSVLWLDPPVSFWLAPCGTSLDQQKFFLSGGPFRTVCVGICVSVHLCVQVSLNISLQTKSFPWYSPYLQGKVLLTTRPEGLLE